MLHIVFPLMVSTSTEAMLMFIDRLYLKQVSAEAMNACLSGGFTSFAFVSFFIGIKGTHSKHLIQLSERPDYSSTHPSWEMGARYCRTLRSRGGSSQNLFDNPDGWDCPRPGSPQLEQLLWRIGQNQSYPAIHFCDGDCQRWRELCADFWQVGIPGVWHRRGRIRDSFRLVHRRTHFSNHLFSASTVS